MEEMEAEVNVKVIIIYYHLPNWFIPKLGSLLLHDTKRVHTGVLLKMSEGLDMFRGRVDPLNLRVEKDM